MLANAQPAKIPLRHPILTPRGMIASLVIRTPTREELDEMEIAAGAVLDGLAVPLAKANPGLVEMVAVLTLLGAMNGVDPAVLTKLTDEDLAAASEVLDAAMRGAMNQMRSS